jgi:tetratricopeptide (TPR) repeat protein
VEAQWFCGCLFLLALCWIPGCSHSSLKQGESCLKIGDYERAALFFEKAVMENPQSFRARKGLAHSLINDLRLRSRTVSPSQSQWMQVIRNTTIALSLQADSGLSRDLGYAYFELAKLCLSAHDSSAALETIRLALENNGEEGEIINYAAVMEFNQGDTARALALLTRAITLDSTNTVALFNIGMIHWQSSEYLKAYLWWYKALRAEPHNKTFQHWFARATVKTSRGVR